MAHQNPRSRHPLTWAVLTILILAPIVATLWVPSYARTKPVVADFPFFYWYQLMWVPIVAITSGLAYALVRRTGRAHAAGRQSAAGPDTGQGTKGSVQSP
jgi:membrane protein implicated in regulation of membrane protease activity